MFVLNDDNSIYVTRGDIVAFGVTADDDGKNHTFEPGDVLRFKVCVKKNAANVVLQKDFSVREITERGEIYLTKEDTKIGGVISKPVDYWYEIELNPYTDPQTILGYDDDGPKIFKLFPEGADLDAFVPTPEDIPFIDRDLDLTSPRPVQNQAVARAIVKLNADVNKSVDELSKAVAKTSDDALTRAKSAENGVEVQKNRIDTLIALPSGATTNDARLEDICVGADGVKYNSPANAVREQVKKLTKGRYGMAALLPSSDGNYPSISTTEKTFTVGGDTLIINDRLPNGWVSLNESSGNNKVVWGSDVTSSAVCFYYDIDNNKLAARNYNDSVANLNYILLATLRIKTGTNIIKPRAVCSCPIYVDGVLSTEVNDYAHTHFAALLPPLDTDAKQLFPKISRGEKTFTIPYDTLIIDNQFRGNYISIKDNNSVYYGDVVSSAVCIYYDIANNMLVAKAFTELMSPRKFLLICTIRDVSKSAEHFMAYASCPVWLDNRLSTDSFGFSDVVKRENFNVKSVNHRGYADAPENTLAAYRLSKKKGFTYVECDVSFTSDGYAVLLHDDTVDRTSNGTGRISNMTFNQVRGLDFGSCKSPEYAGEQIPTFEEFIALCKRLGLHPYIELKMGTEAQIKSLVNTVKRYGMKGNVTWISFSENSLVWVKEVDAKARLGYVVGGVAETTIDTVKQKLLSGENEVFVDCAYESATSDAVNICADADIPLEVWTVNSEAAILALDAYVSGFTSDNIVASHVMYESNIND